MHSNVSTSVTVGPYVVTVNGRQLPRTFFIRTSANIWPEKITLRVHGRPRLLGVRVWRRSERGTSRPAALRGQRQEAPGSFARPGCRYVVGRPGFEPGGYRVTARAVDPLQHPVCAPRPNRLARLELRLSCFRDVSRLSRYRDAEPSDPAHPVPPAGFALIARPASRSNVGQEVRATLA